jgi:hypothetical protein
VQHDIKFLAPTCSGIRIPDHGGDNDPREASSDATPEPDSRRTHDKVWNNQIRLKTHKDSPAFNVSIKPKPSA